MLHGEEKKKGDGGKGNKRSEITVGEQAKWSPKIPHRIQRSTDTHMVSVKFMSVWFCVCVCVCVCAVFVLYL